MERLNRHDAEAFVARAALSPKCWVCGLPVGAFQQHGGRESSWNTSMFDVWRAIHISANSRGTRRRSWKNFI